jgi:putative flippase GtrA
MIKSMPVLVDWVVRFALHVATGFLAVAVHYSLMALLLHAGMQPVLASSLGFVAGAITRFLTAYINVYAPTGTMRAAMPRFLLALAAQFFLNSLLLAGLIETGMGVWWAQVLTSGVLTFSNYLVYRLWVFR